MRDRVPTYRDPALHFDARLVTLRKEGRIEVTLATENEKETLMRAPVHVHPVHAAFCCWSAACSPFSVRSANWLDG